MAGAGRSLQRAALARWRRLRGAIWQRRRAALPLADDAVVTFAIPLIGRARAEDWMNVERNLTQTLGSLSRQSDPRWEAVICGQDRPAIDGLDDRVQFQPFERPHKPGELTDHRHKARAIRDRMSGQAGRDGYLFYLDADDLLHPDLVAYMMTARDPDGYLIAEGYMLDVAQGDSAYLGPPSEAFPNAHPFWRASGSSNAIRFDRRAGQAYLTPHRFRGSHVTLGANMADFGLALKTLPFPAAIYVTNHGGNLRKRRGRGRGPARYLDQNRLPPAVAASVRAEFGL